MENFIENDYKLLLQNIKKYLDKPEMLFFYLRKMEKYIINCYIIKKEEIFSKQLKIESINILLKILSLPLSEEIINYCSNLLSKFCGDCGNRNNKLFIYDK